jgi:hypothetical protein
MTDALKRAVREGRVTGAIATNVGGEGNTTTVYSDDEVTIVEHNGQQKVVPHDQGRRNGG